MTVRAGPQPSVALHIDKFRAFDHARLGHSGAFGDREAKNRPRPIAALDVNITIPGTPAVFEGRGGKKERVGNQARRSASAAQRGERQSFDPTAQAPTCASM